MSLWVINKFVPSVTDLMERRISGVRSAHLVKACRDNDVNIQGKQQIQSLRLMMCGLLKGWMPMVAAATFSWIYLRRMNLKHVWLEEFRLLYISGV